MGLFDGAKATFTGNKAYKTHVEANKLAAAGKPREAAEKYKTALGLYEEAERLGIEAQNILRGYAILLMREGHFDRADALMRRMGQMKNLTKDDWFELRVDYSICLWKLGQLDKAIEAIGRAAQQKMNGMIYGTLGMYRVEKAKVDGDFQSALDFNLEALDYDDEDPSTLDNLGQLYEAMSRQGGEKAAEYRATAMDYYRKAHKAKPRQITTIYYLARMFHQDGDDEKARKLLSVRDTLYISAICPITREMMDELAREVGA